MGIVEDQEAETGVVSVEVEMVHLAVVVEVSHFVQSLRLLGYLSVTSQHELSMGPLRGV